MFPLYPEERYRHCAFFFELPLTGAKVLEDFSQLREPLYLVIGARLWGHKLRIVNYCKHNSTPTMYVHNLHTSRYQQGHRNWAENILGC